MRLTCFLIKAFGRCHFDVEVFLRALGRSSGRGRTDMQGLVSVCTNKRILFGTFRWNFPRNSQNKITQGLADVRILTHTHKHTHTHIITHTYIYIYNVGSSVVYALFICCFPTRACRMRRVQIHHLKKKTKFQWSRTTAAAFLAVEVSPVSQGFFHPILCASVARRGLMRWCKVSARIPWRKDVEVCSKKKV